MGKTLLVRTVARHYRLPMITVNGAELYTAYAGQTEKRLRKVFEKAEQLQPSILFIDEIVSPAINNLHYYSDSCNGQDALCPKRDDAAGSVESRVVAQLLTLMDGLKKRMFETRMQLSPVWPISNYTL